MAVAGHVVLSADGGQVWLPERPLIDRMHGGNLVVTPPRPVWDRTELHPHELAAWGELVAATAAAMLSVLPVLAGGCINYWDAGNWALNAAADPVGPKDPRTHRRVHMHLLGRSASSPDWGEAPAFARYAQWRDAAPLAPLNAIETEAVARAAQQWLSTRHAGAAR